MHTSYTSDLDAGTSKQSLSAVTRAAHVFHLLALLDKLQPPTEQL